MYEGKYMIHYIFRYIARGLLHFLTFQLNISLMYCILLQRVWQVKCFSNKLFYSSPIKKLILNFTFMFSWKLNFITLEYIYSWVLDSTNFYVHFEFGHYFMTYLFTIFVIYAFSASAIQFIIKGLSNLQQ